MISLALDASSTCSGWSVFEDGKYVKSGFINLKKEKDTEHRINEMSKKISELIDAYFPSIVYLEDTMMSSNASTLKLLANLGGAIKFYCYMKDIPVVMLMPSTWRSILHIQEHKAKRSELKIKAMNLVSDQLGLSFVEEDEAEAIAINLSMAVKNGQFAIKKVEDILWN